jgi:hypothetical protein
LIFFMPTIALAQPSASDNPSYNFHFEYTGPNSYWVRLLLLRNSSWSCPTAQGAATSAQGFNDKVNNRCIRDQYVWGAVVSAWHAECGSRFAKDDNDRRLVEASAGLVVFSLGEAARLCSNNPTIGTDGVDNSCATDKVASCADILSLATPSQPMTVTAQSPVVETTTPSQQPTPDSQSTTPPTGADNASPDDAQNENDTQGQSDTQNEVVPPAPNLIQQTADKWQQQFNNMASQKAAKGNGAGNSGSSSGTCGCGQPCNKPGAHPAC